MAGGLLGAAKKFHDAAKALSGKKQFLEDIEVTNSFPENFDKFLENLPSKIKDIRTMLFDPNAGPWLRSRTNDVHKKIWSDYTTFRSGFDKCRKIIEKNWAPAEKARTAVTNDEEEFNIVSNFLKKNKDNIEKSKKNLETLRKNAGAAINDEEIKKLKKQITDLEKSKKEKIDRKNKKTDTRAKFEEMQYEQKAKGALGKYATIKELDKEEKEKLMSGKYKWIWHISKESTEAKKFYEFLNQNKKEREEWKGNIRKKEAENFDKDIKTIDKSLKKLQEELNLKTKEINQKRENKQKSKEQFEGDIGKLSEKKSDFGEYMDNFDEYMKLRRELKLDLENKVKYYEAVAENAKRISSAADTILNNGRDCSGEVLKKAKELATKNTGSDYKEGYDMPLIMAVAMVRYFFNLLSDYCMKQVDSALKTKKSIENFDKELDSTALQGYSKDKVKEHAPLSRKIKI